MSLFCRFTAPLAAMLAAVLLVACGAQVAPTPIPSAPVRTAAPVVDAEARLAFNAAICPVFTGIIEIDPRLAAMRGAGAQGGDMSPHATEIGAIGSELGLLLNDLEAVPDWSSGANLRHQLITALHGIRARLLSIGGDPGASTAANELANLPFIASEQMDLAMQRAVQGGLTCEDTP